jgi:hypothetical protein
MDARLRLDEYEVWSFVTDVQHPVHVHLAPFQVLRRGGRKPGQYDAGWKDTVDIRPAEVVDILVRFSSYKGKYLIHCHDLEHEDMGMAASKPSDGWGCLVAALPGVRERRASNPVGHWTEGPPLQTWGLYAVRWC